MLYSQTNVDSIDELIEPPSSGLQDEFRQVTHGEVRTTTASPWGPHTVMLHLRWTVTCAQMGSRTLGLTIYDVWFKGKHQNLD